MKKRSRKSPSREVVPQIHPVLREVPVGSLEVEARARLGDVLIHGGLAVATVGAVAPGVLLAEALSAFGRDDDGGEHKERL